MQEELAALSADEASPTSTGVAGQLTWRQGVIDEFDSNQDGQLDASEISTLVATVEARGQSLLASLVHTGADAQPASSERALLGRVDSVGSTASTVSLS